MNMVKYKCEQCGKEMTVSADAGNPECCDRKMKQIPLDVCSTAHDAESYRAQNEDDACAESSPDL
jgi:hypothetical protein